VTGAAISGGPIAAAGLRDLATEYGGPRPAGVRETQPIGPRDKTARPTRP
jgi:hypothetical protein